MIVVDILLRVFSRKTSHKMLESLSFCDRDNSNKHNSANVSGDKTTTTTTKLSGESIFCRICAKKNQSNLLLVVVPVLESKNL